MFAATSAVGRLGNNLLRSFRSSFDQDPFVIDLCLFWPSRLLSCLSLRIQTVPEKIVVLCITAIKHFSQRCQKSGRETFSRHPSSSMYVTQGPWQVRNALRGKHDPHIRYLLRGQGHGSPFATWLSVPGHGTTPGLRPGTEGPAWVEHSDILKALRGGRLEPRVRRVAPPNSFDGAVSIGLAHPGPHRQTSLPVPPLLVCACSWIGSAGEGIARLRPDGLS